MKRIFGQIIKAFCLLVFGENKKKWTAKYALLPEIKIKHVYVDAVNISGGSGMSRSIVMTHLLKEESKKGV